MNQKPCNKTIFWFSITLLLLILLSACGTSTGTQEAPPIQASDAQVKAPQVVLKNPGEIMETPNPEMLATQQAALENSGKPGPELPVGDVLTEPDQTAAAFTAESMSVNANQSTAMSNPAREDPQESVPTLSQDEIATRESSLAGSGKQGQTPIGPSPGRNIPCLGSIVLMLVPLVLFAFHKK